MAISIKTDSHSRIRQLMHNLHNVQLKVLIIHRFWNQPQTRLTITIFAYL